MIHIKSGAYGLIEIKFGAGKLIEEGSETLKDLSSKIDIKNFFKPHIYDGIMRQRTFFL